MRTLAAVLLLATITAPTQAKWKPWMEAQYTPEQKKWFSEQRLPNSRSPCCSVADGSWAEEDTYLGDDGKSHWKVRWALDPAETDPAKIKFTEWYNVPDEAVLPGPNEWGRTVVWWSTIDDDGDYADSGNVNIRCFKPGAGG